MYTPTFPYLGNQAIISSGRAVIHSKDDFIFLFGKKGVAISSPSTFTVDAGEQVVVGSTRIQLGYDAKQPLLLGLETATTLGTLLDALRDVSNALHKLTTERSETAIAIITETTEVLSDVALRTKTALATGCLSTQTFTN